MKILSSTPADQECVKFVDFLNYKEHRTPSPFLAAADEFIGRQPELLRRLAQSSFMQRLTKLSPCTPV